MSKLFLKQVLKASLIASMLAGAALTAPAQAMTGRGGPGFGSMFGSGHRMEHMLKSVDATDAQRAQIKQIVQTAMLDMKTQREAERQLHEQGLVLFAAPVVDANAVEVLRQQMSAQQDQVSKRMSQVLVDVSRVLTPEQRAKLVARMQKRHTRMAEHSHGASAPALGK